MELREERRANPERREADAEGEERVRRKETDGEERKKKKKKVSFAEDMVEPSGNNEEYRRSFRKSSKLEDER